VPDPSALFLADRPDDGVGSVVAPVVHGARPLLVEVQGLVAASRGGPPRRVAQGLDPARLAMILGILEQRARVRLGDADVYASVAGALRVPDPALDLAVAVALVSAQLERPVPRDLALVGELGLGGEVRQVARLERRVAEAARLGVRRALVPATVGAHVPEMRGFELVPVRTLRDALGVALEASPGVVAADAGERLPVALVS
jgi:DNA repair protein RadA/Sms